jgi:hypothetical protein
MIDYQEKMTDRQVGRNADLFAQAIGKIPTQAERYAYIRILVGIIEQAHQEWNQAPNKDRQVASLVFRMSRGEVQVDEVAEVVRLLDQERGYAPIPEPPPSEKKAGEEASEEGAPDSKSGEKEEPTASAAKASGADEGVPAGEADTASEDAGEPDEESGPAKRGGRGKAKASADDSGEASSDGADSEESVDDQSADPEA